MASVDAQLAALTSLSSAALRDEWRRVNGLAGFALDLRGIAGR